MAEEQIKMTEAEFERLIRGVELSEAALAVLRKNAGLTDDVDKTPTETDRERQQLRSGWVVIPDRAPK